MSDNVDFGLGEVIYRFYDTDTIERVDVKNTKKAIKRGLVPSVSTILSIIRYPHLETWQMKQALAYYMETGDYEGAVEFDGPGESALFGTQCHSLLEYYVGSEIPSHIIEDPNLHTHICAVQPLFDWLDEYVDEVIFTEKQFASKELGYGGTADMLVRLKDGRLVLTDLKCKKNYKTVQLDTKMPYKYQLSAYRNFFKEEYGEMGIANLLLANPYGSLPDPCLVVKDYGNEDFTQGFEAARTLWLEQYS